MARSRSAESADLGASAKTASLKPRSVTRSRGGTAPSSPDTAFFIVGIAGRMLALMSTATTSSSGASCA